MNPWTAGMGAGLGALLGGPFGGMAGALVGTVLGTDALTLEDSLRAFMAERGLDLISIRSSSRTEVSITFRSGDGAYHTIHVSAGQPAEDVDDVLYDAAVAKLGHFPKGHEHRPD